MAEVPAALEPCTAENIGLAMGGLRFRLAVLGCVIGRVIDDLDKCALSV